VASRVGLDKEAVLSEAVSLLDETDWDGLTLACLAMRLGIRTQSLYAHVDGLEGLRRDLRLRHIRQLESRLSEAATGLAGRDGLMAIATETARYYEEHPGALSVSYYPRPDPEDQELWTALSRTIHVQTKILRSFGLTKGEVNHWLRVISASIYGFLSLQNAGVMVLPGDPHESFRRMVTALADELEMSNADHSAPTRKPQRVL
jgi:AcrR family transcriptional regulator